MCLAGTVALATSCKKNDEQQALQVSLPAFEEAAPLPGEMDRAYIDFNTGKFYWNGEDRIMVYNIDNTGAASTKGIYKSPTSSANQAETNFSYESGTEIGEKNDHYFVFYPVERISTDPQLAFNQNKDNREHFTVAPVQNYTLVGGNPTIDPTSLAMAKELWRLNQAFQMDHIFGVCRVRLSGVTGAKVTSIELQDNRVSLVGNVSMKLDKVNTTTLNHLMDLYGHDALEGQGTYMHEWYEYTTELGYLATADPETGNVVTLNCVTEATPAGVAVGTNTPFYISLRPGALVDGFTITVHYTLGGEDKTKVITKYASVPDAHKDLYTIKPGKIITFTCGSDYLLN